MQLQLETRKFFFQEMRQQLSVSFSLSLSPSFFRALSVRFSVGNVAQVALLLVQRCRFHVEYLEHRSFATLRENSRTNVERHRVNARSTANP